ncbi:MAG: HU family DNA-binding protein [Muribaculaceae bacterium]|nr:HU family DNA-binding protein [Muribaculaceae bacterium]
MNYDTFTDELANAMGLESSKIDVLTQALSQTIEGFCADLDAVAIPGFGTFQPVKTNEKLEEDPSTGKRILLPPAICIEFKSSVVLRKQLNR